MALGIGFNVKKANELMEGITKAYNDYGSFINQQWQDVSTTLRNNWVGEDELDYEKRLVDRICNLYVNSYELVKNSVEVLGDLAKAWYDFQKNNTITGEAVATAGNANIIKPSVTPNEKIVEFIPKVIGDEEDRGLKDASSASTIQAALASFVKGLKMRGSQMFEFSTAANAAFFGEQASAIAKYVNQVGIAIAEVNIAVNDMYTALETLAGSQYTKSSASAAQSATDFASQVETATTDLGGSRWTQE